MQRCVVFDDPDNRTQSGSSQRSRRDSSLTPLTDLANSGRSTIRSIVISMPLISGSRDTKTGECCTHTNSGGRSYGSSVFSFQRNSANEPGRSTLSSTIFSADAECYIDRKRVFGINRLPDRKVKPVFQHMWIAFNDKALVLCASAAAGLVGSKFIQDI